MSPTDRRAATRHGPVATDDTVGGRGRSNGGRPSDAVAIPDIVPATTDGPGPAVATVEPDATERWVDTGSPPVVVGAPAGASAPLRVRGRRPRVRKVTRVVRHLDPWSTFKVASIFSLVLYGVLLTSGVLLWNVASNTGTVDNVERWFTQFGWETFELNGGEIYRNAWVGGLFGVVALTGFAVLLATLFNLVSDMVGGVRVTVLEEEVVERTTTPAKRYVVRRLPTDPTSSTASTDVTPATSSSNGGSGWHVDPGSAPDPDRPWQTSSHRTTVRTARPADG